MLVLDTDHLSEYQKGTSPEAIRLKERHDSTVEPFATTIVTVEEIMRVILDCFVTEAESESD